VSKKHHFLIIDSETTVQDTIADFGAVVVDRKGAIQTQCAVLLRGHFDAMELFYTGESGFWGKASAQKRREAYTAMLNEGSRMLCSVAAVNRWLEKVAGKYNPTLTAYNLPFDADKCQKTGIDLNPFATRFCLWAAASNTICRSKKYRAFALQNHLFNPPTEFGNMTYKTNAECVAGYLGGQFVTEPHTALEDAIQFEVPILVAILRNRKWRELCKPYDWRGFQVRDYFEAK